MYIHGTYHNSNKNECRVKVIPFKPKDMALTDLLTNLKVWRGMPNRMRNQVRAIGRRTATVPGEKDQKCTVLKDSLKLAKQVIADEKIDENEIYDLWIIFYTHKNVKAPLDNHVFKMIHILNNVFATISLLFRKQFLTYSALRSIIKPFSFLGLKKGQFSFEGIMKDISCMQL